MISLFNRIFKNILSNYIPHETIICDGKVPSWVNTNIKQLIHKKNNTYGNCILRSSNFDKVKSLHKVTKKGVICVYSKN